ncbi:MAG: AAA family ATPase, partial [Acidobacteria bacterium]|nr:AAA family ATPase [Candidatus Sulfomarinibacter kjeldsenii]
MLSTIEQIRTALASAYPITLLVSPEEDRQEKLLRRFAASAKPEELPVIVWNCVDGFLGHGTDAHRDPMEALAWIASEGPRGLYLLKD